MSTPTWTIFHEAAGFTTPEFWVASSKGATFSFWTKEAAELFIESPRAKLYNPGPKPLIDDHVEEAREGAIQKLSSGRVTKVGKEAARRVLWEMRNQPDSNYARGLNAGFHSILLDYHPDAIPLARMTKLTTNKKSRDGWVDGLENLTDRDYRIGYLFAGLAISATNRNYRFR